MSPEQMRGERLDARTDIFSFGLVLYEMATGERAFTGETEAILHDAIQNRDLSRCANLFPNFPSNSNKLLGSVCKSNLSGDFRPQPSCESPCAIRRRRRGYYLRLVPIRLNGLRHIAGFGWPLP